MTAFHLVLPSSSVQQHEKPHGFPSWEIRMGAYVKKKRLPTFSYGTAYLHGKSLQGNCHLHGHYLKSLIKSVKCIHTPANRENTTENQPKIGCKTLGHWARAAGPQDTRSISHSYWVPFLQITTQMEGGFDCKQLWIILKEQHRSIFITKLTH